MKTLLIILFTILAIGCQTEEASAVDAETLTKEFSSNTIVANNKYKGTQVIIDDSMLLGVHAQGGYWSVAFSSSMSGRVVCITQGATPQELTQMQRGDTPTVSGMFDYADVDQVLNGYGQQQWEQIVFLRDCEILNAI